MIDSVNEKMRHDEFLALIEEAQASLMGGGNEKPTRPEVQVEMAYKGGCTLCGGRGCRFCSRSS